MPDDAVWHDAECFQERAKQARAIAHERKDGSTKQVLMALAGNFERLAELAIKEKHASGMEQSLSSGVEVRRESIDSKTSGGYAFAEFDQSVPKSGERRRGHVVR